MMAGTATEGPEEGTYISIGAFKDRNDFGAAMATILPFAVIFCLKGKAIEKFLGLILLAVATHGVIASDSRGAQLACIAGLCFTFYLLATSKMARRAALVAGVVGLGIAFLASARLQSIGGYVDDRSAMGRVEAWGVVLENFPSYPLFGRGFGKYRSWMPRGLDTHSSYMRAAGELGIIGLFSYLGMLFVAFRKGYNLTRVDTAPSQGVRILAIASMGALAVNATASLFLTRLYYPFVLVQIGLISSLWIIADRERRLNQSGGLTPPGGVDDERNLWVASRGMGLATRRLVSSMDIAKVVGIVIVCLVSYKIMVLTST
jgi:O-antigen ligase